MGSKFGLAAAVLRTGKYIPLHNGAAVGIPDAEDLDEAWEFEHPVRPDPYDNTPLPGNLTVQQREMRRKKQEAERNEEIVQYDVFEAYETHYKEQIATAYDESYLEALENELLGFTHVTVSEMLEHLREQCLAMTSREKKQKLKEVNLEWEQGDDVRVFLSKVQKLQEQLQDQYDLDWAEDVRMTHIVSEFADSNIFTEEEMMTWEDKPREDQTYAAMVAYFTRCYDKHARYGNAGAPKSHGYESANNVTDQAKEELLQLMLQLLSNQKEVTEAATEDKEHLQAMSDSNGDLLDIIKN